MLVWTCAIVAAYVIGSIPFGYLIGRSRGIDIRLHGSKNVGATNVGRVLGRRWGLTCFLLDTLKGAASVAGAGAVTGVLGRPLVAGAGANAPISSEDIWWWLAVAAAAVLGHMYSIFLGFRGGKGVATGFGATVAMWPLMTASALGALIVWYATARLSRIISLSSMLAAVALPIFTMVACVLSAGSTEGLERGWPLIAVTALLALAVIWKHRANIGRMRRGEEPRVGGQRGQ